MGGLQKPSLIFVSKDGALRSPLWGRLPALPTNIRLACKVLTMDKHSSVLWNVADN
jgi:hypothetical protein